MRRAIFLAMALGMGMILFLGAASALHAAGHENPGRNTVSPTVGLPPLPVEKATLDLPRRRDTATRARQEEAVVRSQVEENIQAVARLHRSVETARANGEKWIEVILGEQKVVAWEGDNPVREFIVSTGLPGTPTVQGVFRIWIRTRSQTMSGGDRASGTYYYLPNVEWVQYFYQEYAFHGTYWHNNFGRPMSHGCVNMTNEDAEWLFKWAMPEWNGETGWLRSTPENATLVWVHE